MNENMLSIGGGRAYVYEIPDAVAAAHLAVVSVNDVRNQRLVNEPEEVVERNATHVLYVIWKAGAMLDAKIARHSQLCALLRKLCETLKWIVGRASDGARHLLCKLIGEQVRRAVLGVLVLCLNHQACFGNNARRRVDTLGLGLHDEKNIGRDTQDRLLFLCAVERNKLKFIALFVD